MSKRRGKIWENWKLQDFSAAISQKTEVSGFEIAGSAMDLRYHRAILMVQLQNDALSKRKAGACGHRLSGFDFTGGVNAVTAAF